MKPGHWRLAAIVLCCLIFVYVTILSRSGSSVVTSWRVSTQPKHFGMPDRAAIAKDAFRHAWDAYTKHGFPDDALKPLSQSSETTRSGWGATVVDGLSTAIMMDLQDIVEAMLEHIQSIDFTATNASVSLFGSTIRYVGGLLSAHDLLTGPSSYMGVHGNKAKMLLAQAESLVTALQFAFDTPSGIPQNNLRFLPEHKHKRTPLNDITAAGTVAFEFVHLSSITGTSISDSALAALNHTLVQAKLDATPFPGLSGRYLNLKTGKFVDAEGGWYGGAGGLYEYLLKLYLLDPARFQHCRDRWQLVANSSMTYLASHPSSRPDLTFLASYNGTEILYNTDHTAHFAGANFLLGGSVLQNQQYIDFGLKLVDSQIEMYRATATGLGPDKYAWLPQYCHNLHGYDDLDPTNSKYIPKACNIPAKYANQSGFYEKSGFYSSSPAYMLRPEVLESCYYAFRITGDARYQAASWEIFSKILEHTRIDSGGFAGLVDVNRVPDKHEALASQGREGGMADIQWSYMLAETIKYAWLIQLGDDAVRMPWHVMGGRRNSWVFSTEGHPLRIRKKSGNSNSGRVKSTTSKRSMWSRLRMLFTRDA